VERLAERAGVTLSAAASWLIVRLHEDPEADIGILCRDFELLAEAGERALAELAAAGLVSAEPIGGAGPGTGQGEVGRLIVIAAGEDTAQRLIEERRASLSRLCAGWVPEENPELAGLLTKLAHGLTRKPRAPDIAHAGDGQRLVAPGPASATSPKSEMIREPWLRPWLRKLTDQRSITTSRF